MVLFLSEKNCRHKLVVSTGLAIVAEADVRCGAFFVRKKLSSQIGSFH